MFLKMFSIYDKKADQFNVPFFFAHDGQAVRAFSDLANDSQSTIAKHPDDYSLYCVGIFGDDVGKVSAYEKPERIVEASALVERIKNA